MKTANTSLLPLEGFIPNPKAKLLDQVREVIRLKHYSIRAEECYVDWIKRYIFFHGKRHPRDTPDSIMRFPRNHLSQASLESLNPSSGGFLIQVDSSDDRQSLGFARGAAFEASSW